MIGKLFYQAFAGPQLPGRQRDSALEAAELTIELPRRIDRVLGEIERGNLRVWTRLEDVEPTLKRLEHMVARSSATILAAACIVGLAIVMQFYHPQRSYVVYDCERNCDPEHHADPAFPSSPRHTRAQH